MWLSVPFRIQSKNDCGPTSLRMVLEFFGEEHDEEEIRNLAGTAPNGGTWAIGIAYASQTLGFQTEFYTKSIDMGNMTAAEHAKKEQDLDNAKVQLRSIQKKA